MAASSSRKVAAPPKVALTFTEAEGADFLGFSWSTRRKWAILTVIFVVQLSMNFNASVYANAFDGVVEKYGVSLPEARLGQLPFLILYGIGSELWAPWSEELGRWPVLQGSLALVNLTQVMCALAPNFSTLLAGRCLGGLFSAGGSVTLGVIADMWGQDDHQYALLYVALASCSGSALGPVFGSVVKTYLPLPWIFWVQLIIGVAAQALHFFVPETRVKILLDREARRRRKSGQANVYGPGELKLDGGLTVRKVLNIWYRPFYMFVHEPIVLFLSLLSGFSDALIFTFFECFTPVFRQWGMNDVVIGQLFWGVIMGYALAALSFVPVIRRGKRRQKQKPGSVAPEMRLWWLLFLVPLEPIGLFCFAWTGIGPPVPWSVAMIFVKCIAIANFSIYFATIDYMIASYGDEYSASATGGNALARDVLAGLAALYSTAFYEKWDHYRFQIPSTILGALAVAISIPVYIVYMKGPQIRERSEMAKGVAQERAEHEQHANQRRAEKSAPAEPASA